jgi:eukaryotic-like serine/threonine-protein kinase
MPASEHKPNEPKKLPGIFISYRRTDNPDAVGRIYDRLASEFGKARVFKDVDSIPLGQDFRGHLNEVVGGCAAVLAIIGPKWAEARSETGQRRLENPDDFVRIELEAALARNVPVVPVLVGHAAMPVGGQLPGSLLSLIYRQAIEVRPDPDFHNDATRLVSALRLILDPNARGAAGVQQKWVTAFAVIAGIAAAALATPALNYLRTPPPQETRVEITTPATDRPLDFAVSPDGRQIAFVARGDGASRLWVRSLASTAPQPLPGTEGATGPFWSPDSRSIGFFASRTLKRIDLGGGLPQTLALAGNDGDGSWGADGTILYVQGPANPISRIAAAGGAITAATKLGPLVTEHRGPLFLPDGKHFLFLEYGGPRSGLYLGSLDGSPPARLAPDLSRVAWASSGWLLWLRGGTLTAQRLDLKKAALTGEAITLADNVGTVSASGTGMVAYRAGAIRQRQLTWVNRLGATVGTIGDPDNTLFAPRVSPDSRRVALSRQTQGNEDLWLLDSARASRMTFDTTRDLFPTWSPDGTRIAFTSMRSGGGDLYMKATSGAGVEQLLTSSNTIKFPTSWSADGLYLLYFTIDPKNRTDIWVLPMSGDRKPFPFVQTPFTDVWGQFSPDGKWVAYQSDESGQDEIYVRSFAPVVEGQWRVSTTGGVHPVWRPDGKELYYISRTGEMMAVSISAVGVEVTLGAPARLFDPHILFGGVDAATGRQYDAAPDGRFLINRELDAEASPPITLIQNWNPDAGK